MNSYSKQNAITQRLGLLQNHYSKFHNHPTAKVCIWFLEADEYSMIEQFLNVESSIDASSPDLFIKFFTPFKREKNYSKSLVTELKMLVERYRNNDKTTGVEIKWQPLKAPSEFQNTPVEFTYNFSAFGKGLENLTASVVAFLNPTEVRDFKKLEKWIAQSIKSDIQDNVRLMIVDFIDNQQFHKLQKQFPELVMTIKPDLQMTEAMKELALAGGSNNPGTQFQVHFIELSKAATKGNMEQVETCANRAMEIAVAEGWLHLQVAVYQAVGSGYLSKKNYNKALTKFESSIRIAKTSFRQGEKIGGTLLANALFAKGAVLVNQQNYEEALSIFEEIVPVTQKDENHHLTMEAYRMIGFCQEKNKAHRAAFDSYIKAMETGELLDEAIQPNTTLPDTGETLLKLNDKHFNDLQKEKWIEERMKRLLGEDWKSKSLVNQ